MGKKSIEKLYHTLFKNLWNELLFFIPNTDLAIDIINKLNNIDQLQIFNIVFVMDKMQGPIEYHKEKNSDIISKSSMLEYNMYLLLKKKQKLDPLEFSYLLDKYFEQVEFCFFITSSLQSRIESNSILKSDPHLRGLFLLQHKAYKKHFERLKKLFYPAKENLSIVDVDIDIEKILKKHFPDLLKNPSQQEIESEVNDLSNILTTIDKKMDPVNDPQIEEVGSKTTSTPNGKPVTKKKKIPIITEQDSKQFVLKSVFGIQ